MRHPQCCCVSVGPCVLFAPAEHRKLKTSHCGTPLKSESLQYMAQKFTLRAMSPVATMTYGENTHLHKGLFRPSKVPSFPLYHHFALPILPNSRGHQPVGDHIFSPANPPRGQIPAVQRLAATQLFSASPKKSSRICSLFVKPVPFSERWTVRIEKRPRIGPLRKRGRPKSEKGNGG